VLARTRPAKGLLGGMTEVPTTEWSHDFAAEHALTAAPNVSEAWRRIPGVVTHTFTHFPLELIVYVTTVSARARAPKGMRWIGAGDLAGAAFPTVMRKVLAHARIA
jgi:A/G-specific adenine glycosylase